MRTLIATVPVVCCLLAVPLVAAAEQPEESIAGIWRLDHGDGTEVRTILLGDTPEVPPEVLADLEAFNTSLAQIPEELRFVATSPNGRGFGIAHHPNSPEPTGVWVWPNWRDASPIVFEDFSFFGFHSNEYVYLQYGEPGERLTSRVAKVTEPDIIYTLPGVSRRHLRVLDDGRWASMATGTGQLIIGQLEPEQPGAGADDATAVPLEFEGTINNLAWVRSGDYLVVEITIADDHQLKVINTATLALVDASDGQLFFGRPVYLDQSRLYGYHEDERAVLKVLATGQVQWEPCFLDDHDAVAGVSPSGQFVMTYWQPGFDAPREAKIRASDLAPPDVQLPTWPEHEVAGEEVIAGRYFWLSWE